MMTNKRDYEKHKKYNKKYYAEHPEYRKQIIERAKQQLENNPESHKETMKKYYKKNLEKIKKSRRRYYKEHPETRRAAQIKLKYNLSYEDWLKMWEKQDGKCVICGKSFNKPSNALVDHNHKTNKVRGLLCFKCNMAIGLLNDNPKLTTRVTEYLLGGV